MLSLCCSSDAIDRSWKILDAMPGRATGAYSHSQVSSYSHEKPAVDIMSIVSFLFFFFSSKKTELTIGLDCNRGLKVCGI